jgi:hypothetical protein
LEFKKIEKENNGLFTLSYLKSILNELEINQKLIVLILSYFKKKTNKSFIDIENMKKFLSRFSQGNDEMVEMLFEIISYPKEFISRVDLISLIKSYKNGLSTGIE